MLSRFKRWKLETEDRLRYDTMVRELVGRYKRWSAPAVNGDQQKLARSIHQLCAAARCSDDAGAVQTIQARIHERLEALKPRQVDWAVYIDKLYEPRMPRTVLLKPWLGPMEKGVVFASFEKEWFKLLQQCDLREFSERYYLIIAPSSSPHNLVNYVFAKAFPEVLFTLISNENDLTVLPRVAPNLKVIPLYASHWVRPELFEPRPFAQRDIDLIMVANFAKVKRHHALFAALKAMPETLRVLLVGQDQDGRTAATIRREASYYGIAQRIALESNADYPAVAVALCRSRASVVLSRREGSCVAVAESLFADTPVALLKGAEIGSRAFINSQTGIFLDEQQLAEQLLDLIQRAETFSPRRWAEENISCHTSYRILNETLRTHALATGQHWTQDIAPFCWRPDPRLIEQVDIRRLQVGRQQVKTRFGIEVGPGENEVRV